MAPLVRLEKTVAPLLVPVLDATPHSTLIDLCSGGGGPAIAVRNELAWSDRTVHLVLTDLYPNLPAFREAAELAPGSISFEERPIDATAVPARLEGMRTVFNSFHHFDPGRARAVLRDAIEARQPIGIFEVPERSLAQFLPLLFTPLFVWLATPFIRPFRWRRLLWTYPLPLVPLTCWWDGLVSSLRAYTVEELDELATDVDGSYEWRSGRVPVPRDGSPGGLTYLIGVPAGRELAEADEAVGSGARAGDPADDAGAGDAGGAAEAGGRGG